MRIAEIDVPKGCNKIYVDLEDNNQVIVSYGSSINEKEFRCKETGEMEMRPAVGDFAIFWNDDYREHAIVANLQQIGEDSWISSDLVAYDYAIKFRDYDQYLAVRRIHEY